MALSEGECWRTDRETVLEPGMFYDCHPVATCISSVLMNTGG